MDLKIPEETLMRLGFRLLDIMYGELTIKESQHWDEEFVDLNGNPRIRYHDYHSTLGFLHNDKKNFLLFLTIGDEGFRKIIKAWFKDRYGREARFAIGMGDD